MEVTLWIHRDMWIFQLKLNVRCRFLDYAILVINGMDWCAEPYDDFVEASGAIPDSDVFVCQ